MPNKIIKKYDLKESIIEGLDDTFDIFKQSGSIKAIEIYRTRYPDRNENTGEVGDPFTDYIIEFNGLINSSNTLKLLNEVFFEDIDCYVLLHNKVLDIIIADAPPEPTPSIPDFDDYKFEVLQTDTVLVESIIYNIIRAPHSVYINSKLIFWELFLQKVSGT